MTYDFSRFSTQSFERFSQSLAVKQFGPATQVYGAGADGAREATFEGRFSAVPNGDSYDGYVVVQAKYRKVTQSPSNDLAWLKKQVDSEFKKFANSKRRLRLPDYYVLVTNITLTPGAMDAKGKRGGTLDDMLAHLETWKRAQNIKEIFIWHADVLRTFLDVYPDIRTTYSSWVISSDVLSAALSNFKGPDFATIIKRVVRNELKDQRGLKTQDSAQSHRQQIYIDDVFVDLPLDPWSLFQQMDLEVGDSNLEDEADEEDVATDFDDDEPVNDLDELSGRWKIVNHVMARLSDKLNPSVNSKEGVRRSAYQRVVVLGGPGQGKSTIGQFLSQLLRARLVVSGGTAPPEIENIAHATIKRAADETIDLTGPARFPIHIALPRYADAISRAGEDSPSLLRYAASTFSKISDETVNPSHLREWMQHYPCLIVLDGLDEVPRTSNRADVIRAIERLVGDIHESEADALLLVTSRPQGYLDDLDPQHWAHWRLADLDKSNAIRFAARLGEVLISDSARRTEVLTILEDAADDASTAPLMISPLQISLLFSLVITRNDIPKDRWTLFERHYEMLRDREIAKGGASGELIRQYRSEIDRIHFDAGFVLQVRAEKKGNASAHFTLGEFKKLIVRNLSDSIIDESEIERVASRVVEIATTRLVFLGDHKEGRIAFDVRSLQEFMAAARIMASPEAQIRDRLSEIALKSHWAHVFRIACSKVYAQASLQDYREIILEILDKLDHGDASSDYRAIRAGARLATNLLMESTAGARQTDKAKLMARAVKILEVGNVEAIQGLANVADRVMLQPLNRAVDENLLNHGGPVYLNTLRLLIILSRQSTHPLSDWATDKLAAVKSISNRDKAALLDLPFPPNAPAAAREFLQEIMWEAGPANVRKWLRSNETNLSEFGGSSVERLSAEGISIRVRHGGQDVKGINVIFQNITSLQGLSVIIPNSVPVSIGWHIVAAAIAFSEHPSVEALAAVVDCGAQADREHAPITDLPWPIASCLQAIATGSIDPKLLAEQIRRGNHGQAEDWFRAEEQWKAAGIELVDAPHPTFDEFDLCALSMRGPPVRRIRKGSNSQPVNVLLQDSHKWPLDVRARLLPLMCFLVNTPDDAIGVANWISDDLLNREWDTLTTRRVAGLMRQLLKSTGPTAAITKLIKKVPGSTKPFPASYDELPDGLVEMLMHRDYAEWGALALYADLPSGREALGEKLSGIDSRYLVTPPSASAELARALVVLRVLGGRGKPEEIENNTNALLAHNDAQPFSSVLRKIYRGKKENNVLEQLVCRAAECALENGLRDRETLIRIIAELTSSRESNLDDATCLSRLGLPHDVDREES